MKKGLLKIFFMAFCCQMAALGAFAQDDYEFLTLEQDGITYDVTIIPDYEAPLYSNAYVIAKTDGTPYTQTEVVIPSYIIYNDEYIGVYGIRSGAFSNASNLKKVSYEGGPIYISKDAFFNCPNLETVEMAYKSGWLESSILVSGFTNCPKLKSLHFSNPALFLKDDHTTGFEGILNVSFEGSCNLVSAGDFDVRGADYPVKPEMSIDWGEAKISIGSNSMTWFTGDNFIISDQVNFGNSDKSIGVMYVKTLDFKPMSDNAFQNNKLENVIYAFKECNNLQSIFLRDKTMLSLTQDFVFYDSAVPGNVTVYVNPLYINEFINHPVWSKFKEILPIDDAVNGIEVDASDAPIEYFNLQGVKIDNPASGSIVISRQGGKTTKMRVN